uniref:Uncharacterized protein n=1 Tax=Plectus sambesii TaxID=2011161 RepID=A0A914UM06_9BILA
MLPSMHPDIGGGRGERSFSCGTNFCGRTCVRRKGSIDRSTKRTVIDRDQKKKTSSRSALPANLAETVGGRLEDSWRRRRRRRKWRGSRQTDWRAGSRVLCEWVLLTEPDARKQSGSTTVSAREGNRSLGKTTAPVNDIALPAVLRCDPTFALKLAR